MLKARRLADLEAMARGRGGMTLRMVAQEFEVSHRTAQRLMRELEDRHPDVTTWTDDDRLTRWRLPPPERLPAWDAEPEDLAALDLAIAALRQAQRPVEAARLSGIRDRLMGLIPQRRATRIAVDHEALLEAQGLAFRPGPRLTVPRAVFEELTAAIKACHVVEMLYRTHREPEPTWRTVHPYGILTGLYGYLVAIREDDPARIVRTYRLQEVREIRPVDRMFERDPGFDLGRFSARSFGVFQNATEYGEVVWRFRPGRAAERARSFAFHPDQTATEEPDGALTVRFHAAGHLEMCWYLYAWGDAVEVLAPEPLRRMVEGYRRGDFATLP